MREVIETFSEEFRRRMANGESSVLLNDESLAILRKLGAQINSAEPLEEIEEVKFASANDATNVVEEMKAPAKKRTTTAKCATKTATKTTSTRKVVKKVAE